MVEGNVNRHRDPLLSRGAETIGRHRGAGRASEQAAGAAPPDVFPRWMEAPTTTTPPRSGVGRPRRAALSLCTNSLTCNYR
eukprot:6189249-Pleurochrysis_carterae.AAC.3